MRNEVTQELKAHYESKLTDISRAKDEVEQKFQRAVAKWNAEREHVKPARGAAEPSGHPEIANAVRAEISRIESAIQEINRRLDDPKSELAAAIRLNRELAELAAYLKGLRYSLGEIAG